MMVDTIAQVGGIGMILVVCVFGLFSLLLPLSAYSAQKWAHRSYQELVKVNKQLEELIQATKNLQGR